MYYLYHQRLAFGISQHKYLARVASAGTRKGYAEDVSSYDNKALWSWYTSHHIVFGILKCVLQPCLRETTLSPWTVCMCSVTL